MRKSIILIGVIFLGCNQAPIDTDQSAPEAMQQPLDIEAAMIALVTPDDQGGESLLEPELIKLRAQPIEAVRQITADFAEVPWEKPHVRHDLIYLLGKLGSDEALPFLESVIYAPKVEIEHTENEGCNHGHSPAISDYVVRSAAINATIRITEAGSQAGGLALRKYLQSADKEWVMQTAIYLFDTAQMTDTDRDTLRSRGLPFEFIAPSPEMNSGIDPVMIQSDIAKGKARKLEKLKREGIDPNVLEPTPEITTP